MQLRDALADYKRYADHPTRSPGERRTTSGLFSGLGNRLVHIETNGSLRDFGYPLSGLWGVERSRFDVYPVGDDAGVHWFDEGASQSYVGDDALVVTDHKTPHGGVTQHDLAIDDGHVSRFEIDADVELAASVHPRPDGRDTFVGQLAHGDAVEAYHAEEHDFLASSPAFEYTEGRVPEGFDELLSRSEVELPRSHTDDCYEKGQLSGAVTDTVPLESGAVAVGHLLTDDIKTGHEDTSDRVRDLVVRDLDDFREHVATEVEGAVPDHHESVAMRNDIRVLSLLSGALGLRIAGLNFDPYYAYSGGHGYMWFRDGVETSTFFFESDERLDLGLDAWHEHSARAYHRTQCEDGSWPHCVWPFGGSLVSGRANAHPEPGDDAGYRTDQTGSVIAFLVAYHDRCADDDLRTDTEETLSRVLNSLDDILDDNGLPVDCQDTWGNMTGRLSHTVATFPEAYAALALSDFDPALTDHAVPCARGVYESIDRPWSEGCGYYAPRVADDELGDRYDSAVLALASAHWIYDRLGAADDDRLGRPVRHVESVFDDLWHDPDDGEVKGLIRFEGDDWRMREQPSEKVWIVSTAWGANTGVELTTPLVVHDGDRAGTFADEDRAFLDLALPDGPLCTDEGYPAEQFFDVGTPDSATPLGWPHALRLATLATLDAGGAFDGE